MRILRNCSALNINEINKKISFVLAIATPWNEYQNP